MSKKTSAQLEQEIKEALAKADRSRRLGMRGALTEISFTNFNFPNINDISAQTRLREDKSLFGAHTINDDAWMKGWRDRLAQEKREYDLNRREQAFIPLDLGFFGKR
jgi:hypothetical protein